MGYVPADVRATRAAMLEPLAAVLRERGVKRLWFAQQCGVSFSSLWNYFNGYDRVPPQFIGRACQVLGIPSAFIRVPEPRDLYIQQPRKASRKAVKSKAKAKAKAKAAKAQATTTTRVKRTATR